MSGRGKKIPVIGGGSAGGFPSAHTAKRFYRDAKVSIIEKEEKTLVPCGIPYIFGTLSSIDEDLFKVDYEKYGIELMAGEKVDEIKRGEKKVRTEKGREIGYDKLVLATGSRSIMPPIENSDLENVFIIEKDYEHTKRVLDGLRGKKKIVLVGGGFVGVELGDELRKREYDVTVVEVLPHCLQLVFDDEFCELVENKLREIGVKLQTGRKIERMLGKKKVEGVELDDGTKMDADAVIITVGTKKNVELAKEAGLKVDDTFGVKVDEYQRTSDEDIFAVGDCAYKFSFFTKKPSSVMLASVASMEARIAGANLFKPVRKNIGVIGTCSTAIRDTAFGVAGLTEKAAKEEGIRYIVGNATIPDKHPPAMPGMTRIKMKFLFEEEEGEIIGAQLCGSHIVGELANMVTLAIENRMTIDEVATFPAATHPCITAPPAFYHLTQAAEDARMKIK